MHAQAYYHHGIIAHIAAALEEYLWLTSQVPEDRLDTLLPPDGLSLRDTLINLGRDFDMLAYPQILALLDGNPPPPLPSDDDLAATRRSWAAADLMLAMKQIRYRFQAVEARLAAAPPEAWFTADSGPTPLALACFALWKILLSHLTALATAILQQNTD
ncbi:MAG: hypothetical protein ACR2M0_01740 [Chloroflexia bacterium]